MPTTRITIPVAYNIPGSRAGGLDLDDEPIGFNGQFSPYMKNMVVEPTRVRKRQGYSRLGTGAAMEGIGMVLINYTDALGVTHLIALTTTDGYQYNATTDSWDLIGEDAWSGDADNQFGYSVVTDASEFTANGGSALCVVNGADDIMFFEGNASDTFDTLGHGFTSFSSCVDLVEFWNHLMIFGFTDTAYRTRSLAFAALGDVDDWSSATSGATTLTDTIGPITRVAKIGYDLAIYSERSISKCQYVGGSTIFAIPTPHQDIGLLSFGALCPFGQAHFFLSTDQQVYSLLSGFSLQNVGKRICKRLFGTISFDNKERVCSGFDMMNQKALFAIPTAGEDYAKTIYCMNVGMDGNPWEMHVFGHDVRSLAVLRRTKASAYCDDAEWTNVYADESTAYCDDLYGQEGADQTCFLTSTGYVYKLDEAGGTDGGIDIDCEYQTEDVTFDEEEFFRTIWFSMTARSTLSGSVANIAYSTDSGETWTELADSPVDLETNWKTHRLPLDVTDRKIRFRISQSGLGDLQLRGNFKIQIVPASERD